MALARWTGRLRRTDSWGKALLLLSLPHERNRSLHVRGRLCVAVLCVGREREGG